MGESPKPGYCYVDGLNFFIYYKRTATFFFLRIFIPLLYKIELSYQSSPLKKMEDSPTRVPYALPECFPLCTADET